MIDGWTMKKVIISGTLIAPQKVHPYKVKIRLQMNMCHHRNEISLATTCLSKHTWTSGIQYAINSAKESSQNLFIEHIFSFQCRIKVKENISSPFILIIHPKSFINSECTCKLQYTRILNHFLLMLMSQNQFIYHFEYYFIISRHFIWKNISVIKLESNFFLTCIQMKWKCLHVTLHKLVNWLFAKGPNNVWTGWL